MSQPTLEAGSRIGPYCIDAVLGHGPCGVTYSVRTDAQESLVLKEFLPSALVTRANDASLTIQPGSEEDFHLGLQRFLGDARTLLSVRHANLAEVTDVIEANATAYVAMKRVQGERLSDALKRRVVFSGEQLLSLALKLLDATLALHASGLIHRDMKENNILLRADGTPVLLDFGATRVGLIRRRLALGQGRSDQEFDDGLDGNSGPWTDIHALSALLFRLANSTARKSDQATGSCPSELVDALRMGIAAQPDNFEIVVDEWRKELVSLQQRLYPESAQPKKAPTSEVTSAEPSQDQPRAPDHVERVNEIEAVAESIDAAAETATAATAPESTAGRSRSSKSASRKQRKKAQKREKKARHASRETQQGLADSQIASSESPSNLTSSPVPESPATEVAAATAQGSSVIASDNSSAAEEMRSSDSVQVVPVTTVAADELVLDLTTGTYQPLAGSAVLPRQPFFARLRWLAFAALGALLLLAAALLFRHAGNVPTVTGTSAPIAAPSVSAATTSVAVAPELASVATAANQSPTPISAPSASAPAAVPIIAPADQTAAAQTAAAQTTTASAPAAPSDKPASSSDSTATAADSAQTQVTELLAKAKEDTEALRLTSPDGQNAMEKLRQVLKLQPDNAEALHAIASISNKYLDLAEGAMSHQQFAAAKRYIDLAQSIDPNNSATVAARAKLDRLQHDAADTHTDPNVVAEQNNEPVDRVEPLVPADSETPPVETTRADELRRRLGGNSN